MAASPLLVWRIKAHCKMPPVWWAALAQRCIVIAPSSPISIPSSACTFRRLAASTRHLCKWPTTEWREQVQTASRRQSNLWHLHLDLHPHRGCHEVECRRQTIDLGPNCRCRCHCCCRASIAIDNCSTNCSSCFGFTNLRCGFKAPSCELSTLCHQIYYDFMLSFCSPFLSQAQIHHWQLEDQSGLSHARANHFNREVQDLGRWGKLPLKRRKAWNGYANYEIRIKNKENTICVVRTGNALIWILIRTENIYINIKKTKRKGENAKCLRRYSLSLI